MTWPIEELLPHAAPMILIDRVVSFDDESAIIETIVRAEHPFVGGEGVPAHLGIEYMAQACGALTGCWAKRDGGKVRVGFLLGTRHFLSHRAFLPLGVTVTIAIRLVIRDNGMGVFDCRLLEGEKLVAEAQLNVYQAESDEAAHAILTREQ
jgi:predicted hotdog family 3-hydroxylacyl-ACP dehydratase